MNRQESYYVYILQCADRTLYTGIARDVFKRLGQHNQGRGARYTRGRRPCLLRFLERHASKSSAMRREQEIKKLTAEKKRALIKGRPSP